jgi:hypothetical protein
MTEEQRWQHILKLDEDLLKGGVILSEWCAFIVREADTAFAKGALLASILTATAGIETYLRSEYGTEGKENFAPLIDKSDLTVDLKRELHRLRKYRNKWVHLADPWEDEKLLASPEKYEREVEEMARVAVRLLRRTIHESGRQ